MATALEPVDAPIAIVRLGIPFYRRQIPEAWKAGECIASFSESTSPDELRGRLGCVAGSDTTHEAESCRAAVGGLPYQDGRTQLELVLGSDAAEVAREAVAAAEPILVTWEHPQLAPTPPPIAPVPSVVEIVAPRGRGRPRVIPLDQQVRACLPGIPQDLRSRLETGGLFDVVADVQDRIVSVVNQRDELCHQVHDAQVQEPRLQILESCLCPRDRRIRPPSVLDVVTGRSAIVQFE